MARLREDATHLSVLTGIRGWAALWILRYHTWVYAGATPILSWISASGFFQAMKDARLPTLLAISLPATLLLATVSYLLVERPFMQMRLRVRG